MQNCVHAVHYKSPVHVYAVQCVKVSTLPHSQDTDDTDGAQEQGLPHEMPPPGPQPPPPQLTLQQVPETASEPAPEFQPQPRVQLRKKKRPPEIEQRMREKGDATTDKLILFILIKI